MACCKNTFGKETEFRPNYAFKALTEKFYARHDNIDLVSTRLERYAHFEAEIEKRLKYDARNRYYAPITENQTYGWLERLAENYTGLDREILMHYMPRDEVMHVEKQIAFDVNREKQMKKL